MDKIRYLISLIVVYFTSKVSELCMIDRTKNINAYLRMTSHSDNSAIVLKVIFDEGQFFMSRTKFKKKLLHIPAEAMTLLILCFQ